jgi:hypothetical protein
LLAIANQEGGVGRWSIDAENIDTVHSRPAPVISAMSGLRATR